MLPNALSEDQHIQRLDYYFQCLVAPLHHFVRLLRLVNSLSIVAVSSTFVIDAMKCCIHVYGDEKGHQIQTRSFEGDAGLTPLGLTREGLVGLGGGEKGWRRVGRRDT